MIFPVATLVKCKLGRALGHEELFEQGLDHLPDSVGATDVKSVHTAIATGSRFPGVRGRLWRPAEFHLYFNEASVNPIGILEREESAQLAGAMDGEQHSKTNQGRETLFVLFVPFTALWLNFTRHGPQGNDLRRRSTHRSKALPEAKSVGQMWPQKPWVTEGPDSRL